MIHVQECYTLAKDSISSDICLSMPCPWKEKKNVLAFKKSQQSDLKLLINRATLPSMKQI